MSKAVAMAEGAGVERQQSHGGEAENVGMSAARVALVEEAEKIQKMNPGELVSFLTNELGERFTEFKPLFLKHEIDGPAFCLMEESHLKEMLPGGAVGDRVHLTAVRERVKQGVRMARRHQVIMEGSLKIEPNDVQASYVLTNGSLKLKYQFSRKIKVDEGVYRSVTSNFVDYIDLNTIEDLDIEETIDVQENVDVLKKGMLLWKKKEEIVTKRENECVKIFISLSVAPHSREAEAEKGLNLTLKIFNIDEGRRLHQALQAAREEHQQVKTMMLS